MKKQPEILKVKVGDKIRFWYRWYRYGYQKAKGHTTANIEKIDEKGRLHVIYKVENGNIQYKRTIKKIIDPEQVDYVYNKCKKV